MTSGRSRRGEQLAQARGGDRRVAGIEVARALLEDVVVDDRAVGQVATQLGDLFAVAHELDLGQPQLFASGDVVGGFIGESCDEHEGEPPGRRSSGARLMCNCSVAA